MTKRPAPSLYPTFTYADAERAITFLKEAFGFEEMIVHRGTTRPIEHAELAFEDGVIMLGSKADPPKPHMTGATSVYVATTGDIDALCESARAAGAEILMEPTDLDYGSRDFQCRDFEGNVWSFGTYRPGPDDRGDVHEQDEA